MAVQGVGGSLIERGGGVELMPWELNSTNIHEMKSRLCYFILGAREPICPVTRTGPARQPVCRIPRMVQRLSIWAMCTICHSTTSHRSMKNCIWKSLLTYFAMILLHL